MAHALKFLADVSIALAKADLDRLAVQLVQLGLVIERVDVAGPTVHEQKNDAPRHGRFLRCPRCHRIHEPAHSVSGHRLPIEKPVASQHSRQGHRGERTPGLPQEFTPGPSAEGVLGAREASGMEANPNRVFC